MQIFPSFASLGKSSGSHASAHDTSFLGSNDIDFSNIFDTFMRQREEAPAHAILPERAARSSNPAPTDPATLRENPPASVDQRQLPATREDFSRLREKLEHLGVDKDVLDRVEDLFDQPGTVTWGQVYEVLREPLEKKANIKLTTEQQRDILNLFNKMGFTPQDAKALLTDLLDNKYDAVWKKVQQMLSTLAAGDTIPASLKEIASLLKALGLDLSEIANAGLKKLDPEAQADLLKTMGDQKLSPEMMAALKTILAAAKGETRLDGDTLAAMQKVVDAALKGEIKLDQKTLTAMQKVLESSGGDTARLSQILQQMGDKELSPEELRHLLAMIKDAAAANDQSGKAAKGEILSEVHKAMALADTKEQRLAQADRMDTGTATPRSGQGDALGSVKSAAGGNNSGAETADQNAGRNAQNNANNSNKSAQGWENFWDKINVKNSAEGTGPTIRDAGADTRSALGQTQSATAAEAAARRIINNAPAPHRAVLQQVHSGLLQNMGQGRQQLTLQLNPPDLGSLTVNLKVFGKEVHAVLRAENQEARQIVAENLPLLRQSLEAQGLRVSRLEVQTQLQDQNQFTQLWQGMDGQKFQEQGARTQWDALGRGQLRNNAKADGQDDPDLAAMLQSLGREGGIDLIA